METLKKLNKAFKTKNEIFREQLEYGENGEKIIEEYLVGKEGRVCMSMRQFNPTIAPIIMTSNNKLTSPDIITFKANNAIFVECKRKESWVSGWSSYPSQLETGLDIRHWMHYTELVRTTFIPLEIYFIQENIAPTGIFKITIDINVLFDFAKDPNLFRIDTMFKDKNSTRMIFFPLELLQKISL